MKMRMMKTVESSDHYERMAVATAHRDTDPFFLPTKIQVMTRFKLNWCGELMNGPTMPSMSTFKILAIMTCVYIIFNWVTSAIVNANDEDGDEYNTSGNEEEGVVIISIVSDLVDLAFGLFVLFITMRTRGFIRRKYDIPTKCCGNCEGMMLVPLCAFFFVWSRR